MGDSYGLSVEAARRRRRRSFSAASCSWPKPPRSSIPAKTVIIPEPDAGLPDGGHDHAVGPGPPKSAEPRPSGYLLCQFNRGNQGLSDICCTSSNALEPSCSKLPVTTGVIFVPDKHSGSSVRKKPDVPWSLERFLPHACENQARSGFGRPAPPTPRHRHDASRSPSRISETCGPGPFPPAGCVHFAKKDAHEEFIIATENGIIHTLEKQNPGKHFFPLQANLTCPNMKKTTLELVLGALEGSAGKKVPLPRQSPKRPAMRSCACLR